MHHKTGQIITRNRKHIKATPTTTEQCLQDLLRRNTVDRLDDILKHFEKQTK